MQGRFLSHFGLVLGLLLMAGCPGITPPGDDGGPNVTTVTVPDVVGSSESDAESAIVNAGLTVSNRVEQASDTVAAGQVIEQAPEAGAKVPEGSSVRLVISTGPSPRTVPPLSGGTRADAEAALAEMGLTVATIREEFNSTIPAGQVIGQIPPAGTTIPADGNVTLIISKGPPRHGPECGREVV